MKQHDVRRTHRPGENLCVPGDGAGSHVAMGHSVPSRGTPSDHRSGGRKKRRKAAFKMILLFVLSGQL